MKIDGFIVNPKVVYAIPQELKDDLTPVGFPDNTKSHLPFYEEDDDKVFHRYGEDTFTMKIGGTTFEVSTHFSAEGKETILSQFKELILSNNLI